MFEWIAIHGLLCQEVSKLEKSSDLPSDQLGRPNYFLDRRKISSALSTKKRPAIWDLVFDPDSPLHFARSRHIETGKFTENELRTWPDLIFGSNRGIWRKPFPRWINTYVPTSRYMLRRPDRFAFCSQLFDRNIPDEQNIYKILWQKLLGSQKQNNSNSVICEANNLSKCISFAFRTGFRDHSGGCGLCTNKGQLLHGALEEKWVVPQKNHGGMATQKLTNPLFQAWQSWLLLGGDRCFWNLGISRGD